MSLPDAAEQRINASEAAATQRKANAMSPEERQTKRNADQQRRREQKAKKMEEREALHQQLCRALDSLTVKEYQTFFTWREGEEPDMDTGEVDPAVELQLLAKWTRTRAADFEVAIQQLARDERLGVRECEDFQSWLLETGLLPDHDSLCDWRCSPEYQSKKLERIMDGCHCEGECSCTYDGEGLEPEMEGYNCDYVDPIILHTQLYDWPPSDGLPRIPAVAGMPPPPPPPLPPSAAMMPSDSSDEEETSTPPRTSPSPAPTPPPAPSPPNGTWGVPTARARYFHPGTFTEAERLAAHTASMSHGETQHHWQLATRSVQGADGRIVMEAFDPEGEIPYYYEPGDLGRPNWAVLSQSGFGDRSAFYLWLDGIGQLPAPLSTGQRSIISTWMRTASCTSAEPAARA